MHLTKRVSTTLSATLLLMLVSAAPLSADEPATAVSLGKNVTLHFEIEGTGMQFTVMTDKSEYQLNSDTTRRTRKNTTKDAERESKVTENAAPSTDGPTRTSDASETNGAEFEGELSIDEATGMIRVTCAGKFSFSQYTQSTSGDNNSEATDEVRCGFDASTHLKAGEKRILARSGDTALVLQVEVSE